MVLQFLLAVSEHFGDSYLTHIMLPVFLVAVGDDADMTFLPNTVHPRIKGIINSQVLQLNCPHCMVTNCCLTAGLRPRTAVSERLATMCVLPLLLAGVLGTPSKREQLTNYLRKLLVEGNGKDNQASKHSTEIADAVRFLWFVY